VASILGDLREVIRKELQGDARNLASELLQMKYDIALIKRALGL
jgi:hypothetical protein